MEPDNRTKGEISAILNRLKWHLTDLHMTGIKYWPMKPRRAQSHGVHRKWKLP